MLTVYSWDIFELKSSLNVQTVQTRGAFMCKHICEPSKYLIGLNVMLKEILAKSMGL